MGGIGEFPKAMTLHAEARVSLLAGGDGAAAALRISHGGSTVPTISARRWMPRVDHRLTLLEGDNDNVLPGIHARFGEGHTLGQQFVVVETAQGPHGGLGRLRLCGAQHHRQQQ